MKKISIALLVLVTIISACSEQKFAFRKKIRVDSKKEEIVKKESKQNEIVTSKKLELGVTASKEIALAPAQEKVQYPNLDKEKEVASTQQVSPLIVEPEWKQSPKTEKEKASPKETKKAHDNSKGFAIAGFVFSLLGWLIAGIIFCTLGVIFSALGLKSEKKGLAIAGIIIGIVGLFFTFIAISML